MDVECVILFGSRARGDWNNRSDIDLMIIEPDTSELIPRMGEIQQTASELADLAYQHVVDIDFVYLSRAEYERKSRPHPEPRRPVRPPGRYTRPAQPGELHQRRRIELRRGFHGDEPMERRLRIADANMYYRAMHGMRWTWA